MSTDIEALKQIKARVQDFRYCPGSFSALSEPDALPDGESSCGATQGDPCVSNDSG